MKLLTLAGILTFLACVSAFADDAPSSVTIDCQNGQYRLLRNGTPYFIKGAVGANRLDLLKASGGNSIRASVNSLDAAQKQGLTVLVGLSIGNPRHGFDYSNPDKVRQQFEKARDTVRKYKNHPALLMWALGNEMEINTTPSDRVPVWKSVNDIARMIHEEDGKHPVITVMGDAYKRILTEVKEQCPNIDAMGLNAYADMLTLPEDITHQGWSKPYVVTEFGPRGHWQVTKTPWGVPLEDSSTEKAAFYLQAYKHSVANQPLCLGSYVFYWSQKQEKTHTWYGMFLPDGSRTEAIDAMQLAWTGAYPTNRCPLFGPDKIEVISEMSLKRKPNIYLVGSHLRCAIQVSDPDNDPITIQWDLRPDVADNPKVGGDWEPEAVPIEDSILSGERNRVEVRLPSTPGKYRLFVYAHDNHGGAATANLPLLVVEKAAEEPRPEE